MSKTGNIWVCLFFFCWTYYTPTNTLRGVLLEAVEGGSDTISSGLSVCWWKMLTQTSPAIFKSSKGNLPQTIPRKCVLWGPANWFKSYAPFSKLIYTLISCDTVGIGGIFITISDSWCKNVSKQNCLETWKSFLLDVNYFYKPDTLTE